MEAPAFHGLCTTPFDRLIASAAQGLVHLVIVAPAVRFILEYVEYIVWKRFLAQLRPIKQRISDPIDVEQEQLT